MKKRDRRAREAAKPERVVPAWTRLAVTLGVPLVVTAGPPLLGLPGLEPHALKGDVSFDVCSLGLMPYLWAAIAVELVVASLGRADLRNGPGRKKLATCTVALAIAIALVEGYDLASSLQSMAAAPVGAMALTRMTVTLATGTILLALAADVVTRFGLASGYALLAAVELLARAGRYFLAEPNEGTLLLRTLASAAATAAVTWWALRGRQPSPRAALASAAYRAPSTASAQLGRVQLTAPGGAILALVLVDQALQLAIRLRAPIWFLHAALHPPTGAAASVVLVTSLSAVFAWLFSQPKRVATVAKAAGAVASLTALEVEARAALARTIVPTCLYAVTILAIGEAFNGWVMMGIALGAVPAALALDVAAEWRARRRVPGLVPVWCDQRPYAMVAARAVLAEAGVETFVRAERLRRLLPLLAPFAPLEIFVPAKDAARAAELLAIALGSRAADVSHEGDVIAGASAGEVTPRPPSAKPWWAIAATVALGLATIGVGYARREPPETPRAIRSNAIQILPVDDRVVAFEQASPAPPLPSNATVEVEHVPVGPEKTVPRSYVRWVAAAGETPAKTRAAFIAWANRGRTSVLRLFPGPLYEYDIEQDRDELVGVRSWALESHPIILGSDLVSAKALVTQQDDGSDRWIVSLKLTPGGAQRLRAYTRDHVGERMAIVVDGEVVRAPHISSELGEEPWVQISMSGDLDPDDQHRDADRLVDAMTVVPGH